MLIFALLSLWQEESLSLCEARYTSLLFPYFMRFPTLRTFVVWQSLPSDTNGDGLLDRLMVNVQMPLHDDEEIHSVKMLVFFRTRLRVR